MSHRIACHKKCKTFERTYDKALLEKAQKQVLSGEYNLTSRIKEAKYMQTKMFKYVELEKVNQMVRDEMAKNFYSVQTDFMSLEGKDIPQSVECAIESFITAS